MLKPALFIILRTCSNIWNWHLVILSIRSNIMKILRSISLKVNYWIVDWPVTYLPNLVMHLISRYSTLSYSRQWRVPYLVLISLHRCPIFPSFSAQCY